MTLKLIKFVDDLPQNYEISGGYLLIKTSLPKSKILEIIEEFLP